MDSRAARSAYRNSAVRRSGERVLSLGRVLAARRRLALPTGHGRFLPPAARLRRFRVASGAGIRLAVPLACGARLGRMTRRGAGWTIALNILIPKALTLVRGCAYDPPAHDDILESARGSSHGTILFGRGRRETPIPPGPTAGWRPRGRPLTRRNSRVHVQRDLNSRRKTWIRGRLLGCAQPLRSSAGSPGASRDKDSG